MKYFEPKSLSADDIRRHLREELDDMRPGKKSGSGGVQMSSYCYVEDVYPDEKLAIVEKGEGNCYGVKYEITGGKAKFAGEAQPLKEVYAKDGQPIPLKDIFKEA